ncbi:MAG: flagellar transcriptional regulator FlhD [Betaproteobacteria bacterium]|nr:flagellar transcriptional regulator FlhD [Betaproteobacteria bacterium]
MNENNQLMAEIREANLAYLMLAQHMIRLDRPQALFRLGLTEEVAHVIDGLSPQQIVRVSNAPMMMCRFRFDDEMVWGLLANHGKQSSTQQLHAGIVMAGRLAEEA